MAAVQSSPPTYPPPPFKGEGWGGGAECYASLLLKSLGIAASPSSETSDIHPALANARAGLVSLTGNATPQLCPAPLASCADGALLALEALVPDSHLSGIRGSQLLTERAALMGLKRNGRIAPGGSCRLLHTFDERIAINLPREEDWAMLPAWLESDRLTGETDQWEALAAVIAGKSARELVDRGRLMGLAVAAECMPKAPDCWFEVNATGPRGENPDHPMVLDLSTLWAGPLCSHLLEKLGARVIKVESILRPDGARSGNTEFYDLLNEGKESLALDLKSEQGIARLKTLIAEADIVIESARPRGLRQMGISAEELIADQPGLSWISITGYGRNDEQADWVGFGDDAAIAAGLSGLMQAVSGESMFVGDAIADPLTGLHAALVAWHSHRNGGGQLISLALRDVTAHCASFDQPASIELMRARYKDWQDMLNPDEVRDPQPRYASVPARALGADNAALADEFSL